MIALVLVLVVLAAPASARAQEYLSLSAKHWAPRVTSKSGIGTANAVAEAKATRADIAAWCENWTPGDAGCVARELATPEATKTHRATADCTRGRITAVFGTTYTLDGVWDASDVGAGRTRWRDPAGTVVGRDNASGGLDIAQQWELLCPGPLKAAPGGGTAARPAPPAAAGVARAPAPPAGGAYAVGDVVEAKYGRDWVRGRIDKIRPGPEYDVRLENGQRGILPPRMIRRAP